MNAKKIMGAVLVALLAAALFVGAGAAAPINDGDAVFVYQKVDAPTTSNPGVNPAGVWTNKATGDTLTFTAIGSNQFAILGENIVEGVYEKGSDEITVLYPTADIVGSAGTIPYTYNFINAVLYAGSTINSVTAAGPVANLVPSKLVVTGPDGVPQPIGLTTAGGLNSGDLDYIKGEPGTYKVQAAYTVGSDFQYDNNLILGKDVFTITVKEDGDVELSATADTIIKGEAVAVTITAEPGSTVILVANGFSFPSQIVTPTAQNNGEISLTMNGEGKLTVYLTAESIGSKTILAKGTDASLDVEVILGEITIKSDKETYFVGENIVLSGTATGAPSLYFYIEGTNVKLALIGSVGVDGDKTWEKKITYKMLKDAVKDQELNKLDAGSYTIYAASANTTQVAGEAVFGDEAKEIVEDDNEIYSTIVVNLKQPFLTAELKAPVVAQGSDLVVTGTAESADEVRYYIFGTNFFESNKTTVKQKDSSFKIEMKIKKEKMAAGQYFLVVQHPMYDEMFNIAPNKTQKTFIILNSTGNAETTAPAADGSNILFKVNERQTSNAAEALCQAIDTENIDDIYVKASFIVAAPSLTMNPVASEIAQGEKITVSGTTNLAPGSTVTVEMLSTAFAAVPKASVNSASFIALTTKVADDGTWEVTFDTTGLNVDEYTLTATAGEFVNTAKVKVVEAAPEQPDTPDTPDVPDTPDTPDTPDVPETPGFGALAALAGLGAVAVLLLRRE